MTIADNISHECQHFTRYDFSLSRANFYAKIIVLGVKRGGDNSKMQEENISSLFSSVYWVLSLL